MVILPNDVLQEVFQLLCCPRALPPEYTGRQKPTGYGLGEGADGVEIVNLFDTRKLPTVYQLAWVCRTWRRLAAEVPRVWNYQLILDCSSLTKLYRNIQDDGRPEDILSHPQIVECADRLDHLLSVRERYPQEGGRKEPLLLTVTIHGTPFAPLNHLILSVLFRYSPQLSRVNFVGGCVAPGSYSYSTFDSLEELHVCDPSGTQPFLKLLHLPRDMKPETTFPRLHALTLAKTTSLHVTPYLPWAQLTSLLLGSVGLKHTAAFDSDPDDVIDLLRLTPSLRYLRISGRMRRAREVNSCPEGQTSPFRARSLVVLPHLTHLEIHDFNLAILTSPLFMGQWSLSDKEKDLISPGVLYTPSLGVLDMYLPDELHRAANENLGYRIPPISRIVQKFLKHRVHEARGNHVDGDAMDEGTKPPESTLHRITLRVAIVSPSLLTLPYNQSSTVALPKPITSSAAYGPSATIFRLLLRRLHKPIGRTGTLEALQQLLVDGNVPNLRALNAYGEYEDSDEEGEDDGDRESEAHEDHGSGEDREENEVCDEHDRIEHDEVNQLNEDEGGDEGDSLDNHVDVDVAQDEVPAEGRARARVAHLEQLACLEKNSEGKVYRGEEVVVVPLTRDVLSTERYVDRFFKLAASNPDVDPHTQRPILNLFEDGLDTSWDEAVEFKGGQDATSTEAITREVLRLLTWDGTSDGDVGAVDLERWLYLLVEQDQSTVGRR
ncbi:hypothetical protein FA13DRAFT_1737882 [Coprinellus micaceus]|uniref:F-box domain-containing protein n=1 Tax=Coprinellus micaceus TaxID=71717 RepID=A0A4Y7SWH9_COPMI|nr:hypothetical protein FA13DRAFT_1737882 [Coprinellus micaceus]